jgi:hypothetical protein
MEKQNVTLSLPRDLLRKAKILAASQDKSLSGILKESLEEKVAEAEGYKKARNRQLRMLKQGLSLGTRGQIDAGREELHERG